MDFPCILAKLGLLSPDHQGQVIILLQNCRYEKITITIYSDSEFIENVKNPQFDEISGAKTNEWEAKTSANAKLPEPEPMSQGE
jgi:hypothetical protein